MKLVLVLTAMLAGSPVPALAACLTDAQIDAAVGGQVRSGAPYVSTQGLGNTPLCSGLTIAQAIQRIRAAAFPEEQARLAAQTETIVAADEETAARKAAESESMVQNSEDAMADDAMAVDADAPAVDPANERAAAERDALSQRADQVVADPAPRKMSRRRSRHKH